MTLPGGHRTWVAICILNKMKRVKHYNGQGLYIRFRLSFTSICFLIFGVLLFGCAETPVIGSPIGHAKLSSGTYEGRYKGWPNKAVVNVAIKENRIEYIEIVEHQAWRGKKSGSRIVERIIASQSTIVDAVSGATNSSRVIMNAVQNAVEKAYQNH
ncbi:FMN-binding protein [Thermodesulfobacteriota bacterium]